MITCFSWSEDFVAASADDSKNGVCYTMRATIYQRGLTIQACKIEESLYVQRKPCNAWCESFAVDID